MNDTLGSRVAARDARRFVGRVTELAALESLLGDDPSASVVLVHGPGGIGKSTLLRELERRAGARGRETFRIDGRELEPVPDALEDAIGGARSAARPLVLIDGYDAMYALGHYLRAAVLPTLSADAVVVIAARREPEAAWFRDGWEHVAIELGLGPLVAAEAEALLDLHGVADAERAAEIVRWAAGSPLALALAADAVRAGRRFVPDAEHDDAVVGGLVRSLLAAEVDPGQRSVLGVAAIARVTTVELLAAVLPERDAAADFATLARRTFTESRGDGVTLHELTGRAALADLRRRDPEHERELRRRIADALYERALAGRLSLTIDLAHLVRDPAIRWGYGWDGSERYRVDGVRDGDAAAVEAKLGEVGRGGWWGGTDRWFAEAPERICVVRDGDEQVSGYATAMTPANAPAFARHDHVVGRWLEHARETGSPSVVWRDAIDFTGDGDAPVQAMLGLSGILRSGLENPRYAYLPVEVRLPAARAFVRALGAEHLPELDAGGPDSPVQCFRLDYGPGGLLGAQRDVVYRELGLEGPAGSRPRVTAETVRAALRELQVPHRLAASPLAEGGETAERAAFVHALLVRAVEEAFGTSEDERLLRAVLVSGYLEPVGSHELAAEQLHVSRSAYFRRLRVATERLAEHLSR